MLANIHAINIDEGKGPAILVRHAPIVAAPDDNLPARQKLADALLGDLAKPSLGVALRVPDLRRIDIENTDGLAIDHNGVAINGADGG